MDPIPKEQFEKFHKTFLGDDENIFEICMRCGGKCEYHKIGTLIPGEADYIASMMNLDVNDFRKRYLDKLKIDNLVLDVLKFSEPCPFLREDKSCQIKDFKVVMCEIYPIVFEVVDGQVDFFLDDECPLVKNDELAHRFRTMGINAMKELDIPIEWFVAVERYDHLNVDYIKLSKGRVDTENVDFFTLDDLIECSIK